jgi:N utilization substance protein A
MGDVVTGTVSRREAQSIFINVNKVEAELPRREQVPTEPYRQNDRLKVYVYKVDDSQRRLRVIVSRTTRTCCESFSNLKFPRSLRES